VSDRSDRRRGGILAIDGCPYTKADLARPQSATVEAVSVYGVVWSFPIESPADLSVQARTRKALVNSSPPIDRLVLQGWREDRCPSVEGMVFADGRIVLLQAEWELGAEYPEKMFAYRAQKDGVTSIGELKQNGELEWTYIARLVSPADERDNLRVWCGETSWGSEGFVALATADTDQPIWIAMFGNSNPFESATLPRRRSRPYRPTVMSGPSRSNPRKTPPSTEPRNVRWSCANF